MDSQTRTLQLWQPQQQLGGSKEGMAAMPMLASHLMWSLDGGRRCPRGGSSSRGCLRGCRPTLCSLRGRRQLCSSAHWGSCCC